VAKNHVSGEIQSIVWTNGGTAVDSGDPVVLGGTDGKKARIGVALVDIANAASGAVAVSGVFQFAKVSGAVILAGESVSWDSSAAAVDDNALTLAAGDVGEFGMAVEPGTNGQTTINVDISEPGIYEAG